MRATRTLSQKFINNVGMNVAGSACVIGINLILTPYLVRTLGPDQYGLWRIVLAVVALSTLLDSGMLGAARRAQARAFASGSTRRVSRALNASLRIYGGIGLAAALAVSSTALWLPAVLAVPPDFIDGLRLALVIGGATVALTLAVRGPLNAVLLGSNRFAILRTKTVLGALSKLGLVLSVFATWRADVVAACVAFFAAAFVDAALGYGGARVVCPKLRLTAAGARRTARAMMGAARHVTLLTVGWIILNEIPGLLIAKYLGLAEVTSFAIPLVLVGALRQCSAALSTPLLPLAARVRGRRGPGDLQHLHTIGTRVATTLALCLSLPIMLYADNLIGLWIGPSVGDLSILVAFFLAGYICEAAHMPARHLLVAVGQIRAPGWWQFGLSAAAMVGIVTALSCGTGGLLAVAAILATVRLLFTVITQVLVCRQFSFPLAETSVLAFWLPLRGMLVASPGLLLIWLVARSNTTVGLGVALASSVAVCLSCAWFFSLSSSDRSRVRKAVLERGERSRDCS